MSAIAGTERSFATGVTAAHESIKVAKQRLPLRDVQARLMILPCHRATVNRRRGAVPSPAESPSRRWPSSGGPLL
jgi:hypothetical protein